ncbi:5'-nucleotidase domain-containing protein 3-like [Daphnia pulicaria]|uniref:5'-nucleotidase domain-containing protein 3-like n=1 Tax=Daphnia pulicaria TaxID=35523 RepID=UPI001EEA725E|nr:5'-nucleotidase domain-containing protein 3-like [Daphnia pulicaria]
MCSLLGQRIFKHSRTPKYILPSTIFPIQKYFVSNVTALEDAYENAKAYCKGKKPPPDVEVDGIFATNELDLKNVSVYGFDYDYTLACYKESVDHLIYNLGRETLVRKLKYPSEILKLNYQPGFAVRGLHFDIGKGLLLKVDSFHQIQLGCVYRGLTPLSDEEVLNLYGQHYIPADYLESYVHNGSQQGSSKMAQLADLFSVPEMSLLCNATEYFVNNHIDYHPDILFRDVKNAVQSIHPVMHQIVQNKPEDYLEKDPQLEVFFNRLINAGKKLFLVTNSPFNFVNKGMQYLIGKHWRDIFDVVIVQARKPKFFTDKNRPFRIYDLNHQNHVWDKVRKLEKGQVYTEGTVSQLQDMTGWKGGSVLYFGDHPYTDLADASLMHGWRTGAIIKELTSEIQTLNTSQFKWHVNWLQVLQQLIEQFQESEGEHSRKLIKEWIAERDQLRKDTKHVFNEQFGSLFRTYHNPTYFSRRLFRFADVYTSNVTNFLRFSPKHTFYARRGALPHEYRSWFV